MARLRGVTRPFHIWDTPFPPPLGRGIVGQPDQTNRSLACHLGTVELSLCTGITFFVAHGSTYAVHTHTKTQLYADRTFKNLTPERRETVTWIYMPIEGQITEISFSVLPNRLGRVSQPQHLLVR